MARALAVASDPTASAGAEQVLADGGSATDGVIAAFLCAAAADESVLLGPVVGLVAGVGAGARCFDGRTCQPGAGAKRPRGLRAGEVVPAAARAAVPRSLGALALMHAYGKQRPMSAVVQPALALARQHGSPGREELLAAVKSHGALALVLPQVARALLHAAGPQAGGLMTEEDLKDARPSDVAVLFVGIASGAELAMTPWDPPATGSGAEVVVVADGRGMVAAVSYCPDRDGLLVPELGLRLARGAVPVQRGVPRITPRTPLPSPSPIGILRRPADGWYAALGAAGALRIGVADLSDPSEPLVAQLERLREATRATRAVAAAVHRGKTACASF